jgi:hypothetical protein
MTEHSSPADPGVTDTGVTAGDDLDAARAAMTAALEPGLPLPEQASRLAAAQASLAVLLEGEPSA